MIQTTHHIPVLETERLILRGPRLADLQYYTVFKTSQRSKFTNGPIAYNAAVDLFATVAGQWVLRDYGLFMAAPKSDPDTVVGGFGVFHPQFQDEPEFGWSLYDEKFEGQGFVTEAMRAVIPWSWSVMGVGTAQSHIDAGNDASVIVAQKLGAVFDPATTEIANGVGGQFDGKQTPVNVWRHTKGALT